MNDLPAITESSSVKAPLRITTASQLRAAIQPTVKVYNPTDETETVEIFGDWYTFKPKSAKVLPHKMRYLTTLDKNPMAPAVKTLWDEPPIVEVASEDIAVAICSDSVRGQKGFIALLGDGQDDERMALADAQWITWRLEDARAREAHYVSTCVELARVSPGSELPRMKKDVKAALLWLKRYEAGEFRVAEASAKEIQEERELLLSRAPDLRDLVEGGEESATARTRAQEAIAAAEPSGPRAIMAKAKALGIPLRHSEMEGLLEGDPDMEKAVIRRLAQVAADQASAQGLKKGKSKKR